MIHFDAARWLRLTLWLVIAAGAVEQLVRYALHREPWRLVVGLLACIYLVAAWRYPKWFGGNR